MTTMELAFDATALNADRIPENPPPFAVGGYINGAITEFIWSTSQWDRFPDSYHIRINVTGEAGRGNALDVENGDAIPADVQPWIMSRTEATDPLLVYCNRSNLAACSIARDAAQKATGVYAFIWCATLDGTLSGRAMTQITQVNDGHGVFADLSVIQNKRLLAAMTAHLGGT